MDLASPTSYGAASVRPRYRIEPEQVMSLQNGEAFVISRGERLKIRVVQVPLLPRDLQQAESFMQQEELADQQRRQASQVVLPPLPSAPAQKAQSPAKKNTTKKSGGTP